MKDLQEATEQICDLKGTVVALDTLLTVLLQHWPPEQRPALAATLATNAEVARTVLLHAPVSEVTRAAFERDVRRAARLLAPGALAGGPEP
jgi:hypothetical protein